MTSCYFLFQASNLLRAHLEKNDNIFKKEQATFKFLVMFSISFIPSPFLCPIPLQVSNIHY